MRSAPRHPLRRQPLHRVFLPLLLVLGLALGTAACASGDEAMTGAADGGGVSSEGEYGGAEAPEDDGEDAGSGSSARRVVATEAMVRTGEVVMVDEDLAAVRAGVDGLLARYGGHVADETTESDEDGVVRSSTLVLRVPVRHFSDLLAGFGDLTTVTSTRRSGEDVGTEIVDVQARIRTDEVSLRRLRGFLDKAENVETMIRLESQITAREADLASLRAQAAYLDDQVAMSTVTARMYTPDQPAAEPDPLEGAGFLAGLRGGWNALTDVLLVAATALGAALPFAALAGLLSLPLLLWLRLRRRRPTPAA